MKAIKRKQWKRLFQMSSKSLKKADKELNRTQSELEKAYELIQAYQRNLASSLIRWNIRRILVGGRGSGKTQFIIHKIIPQLSNYIVVDLLREYTDIHSSHKLVFDIGDSYEKIIAEVLNCISSNPGRFFILDNFNVDLKTQHKILSALRQQKCGYILSFSSFDHARSAMQIEDTDLIYIMDRNTVVPTDLMDAYGHLMVRYWDLHSNANFHIDIHFAE